MWVRICCWPPITRLSTKSASPSPRAPRTPSGRGRPRRGIADEPPQQPHCSRIPMRSVADVGAAWVRLAVLAPAPIRVAREVELRAVGIEHEDDPDLTAVDELRDLLVDAVVIGEDTEQVQRLLDRHVLVTVVSGCEQHLWLAFVHRDVVADLGRPEVPTPVAIADREEIDDSRVGCLDHVDLVPSSRGSCGRARPRPGSRRGGRTRRAGPGPSGSDGDDTRRVRRSGDSRP